MNKITEKIAITNAVFKGTEKVQKLTENITTNEKVAKGTDKLEYMKEAVVKIRRKDLDKFEGYSKESIGWFNLDND